MVIELKNKFENNFNFDMVAFTGGYFWKYYDYLNKYIYDKTIIARKVKEGRKIKRQLVFIDDDKDRILVEGVKQINNYIKAFDYFFEKNCNDTTTKNVKIITI